MDKPLRLLIIEDSEMDMALILHELQRAGNEVQYQRIETKKQLQQALPGSTWDAILCDYTLPQFNGLEALQLVRKQDEIIPFIIVSGTINDDTAVAAMKNGANDYVLKNNLKRLAPAIARELKEADDKRALQQTKTKLDYLATHDPLTNLANQTTFLEMLTSMLPIARGRHAFITVIFLDIDRFKLINDVVGRQGGDLLLKMVADRLREQFRFSDVIARLGEDKFSMMSPVKKLEDVNLVLEKLQGALSLPFHIDEQEFHVAVSIGVSVYPRDAQSSQDLLNQAHTAAEYGKEHGGNTYQIYTPGMISKTQKTANLENILRFTLANKQFQMHYQPLVSLQRGYVVGTEALLRLPQTGCQFISPAEFIPTAEETGLIIPIGKEVLRMVCEQYKFWQQNNLLVNNPLKMAVNISSIQLQTTDFVAMVASTLQKTGLEPTELELEITESAIMLDVENNLQKLQTLKKLGVGLVIDDFGTGYSSFSYLQHFKADKLKIDKSFVDDAPTDANSQAILKAIIAMAHALGMVVVAEGVETQAQLALLAEYQCDQIQGYYFSKPLPPEDFATLLQEKRCLKF